MSGAARAILALGLAVSAACAEAPAPATVVPPPAVTTTPPPPEPEPPPPEAPVPEVPRVPDRPFDGLPILPGVEFHFSPVEQVAGHPDWVGTTLDLLVREEAGAVGLDWFTPYGAPEQDYNTAPLEVNVTDWRVELWESGATLHSLDIQWDEDRTAAVRFRSADDPGSDPPILVCNRDICLVTRQ